jgi:hypothetical protein
MATFWVWPEFAVFDRKTLYSIDLILVTAPSDARHDFLIQKSKLSISDLMKRTVKQAYSKRKWDERRPFLIPSASSNAVATPKYPTAAP